MNEEQKEMTSESTHRKVIEFIGKNFQPSNLPFAIWEIRKGTGVSTSSVVRTLGKLVDFSFVIHSDRGYGSRHYRCALRWQTTRQVIEDFELGKILKI